MDAIHAIRTRRSVRAFRDEPVARALFEELIVDASQAPFTPIAKDGAWRFTVVLGRERLAEMGERALAYARSHRPQLAGYEWTETPAFSVFHGAPAAIVVSGREALPVALEECTRAGQLLDVAAHARGLGACWVGSPMLWLRDSLTRSELGIPSGWMPYAAFAIGWPAAKQAPGATRPPAAIDWIES